MTERSLGARQESAVCIDGYQYYLCDYTLMKKLRAMDADAEQTQRIYAELVALAKRAKVEEIQPGLIPLLVKSGASFEPWVADGPAGFKRMLKKFPADALDICKRVFRSKARSEELYTAVMELALEAVHFECLYWVFCSNPRFMIPLGRFTPTTDTGVQMLAFAIHRGRGQWVPTPLVEAICAAGGGDRAQFYLFDLLGNMVMRKQIPTSLLWLGQCTFDARKHLDGLDAIAGVFLERVALSDKMLALTGTSELMDAGENEVMRFEKRITPIVELGNFVWKAVIDLWLVLRDAGLPVYVIESITVLSQHTSNAFASHATRIASIQGVINSARAIREKRAVKEMADDAATRRDKKRSVAEPDDDDDDDAVAHRDKKRVIE